MNTMCVVDANSNGRRGVQARMDLEDKRLIANKRYNVAPLKLRLSLLVNHHPRPIHPH